MKRDESIYQVFGNLRELVKETAILPVEEEGRHAPNHARPAQKSDDESEVFLEAMKGVKRIDREESRVREITWKDETAIAKRIADRSMNEVIDGNEPLNVVNLPEYMEGYVDDVNPITMEKLRAGEFSIQRVLDLHGLSAAEARGAFRGFLMDAVHSRTCCVRIIHGRGLKSPGEPVLKEKLKQWILQAMHRKWVVAFCSCRMADGGPGATTLLLRTTARKRRLQIIG